MKLAKIVNLLEIAVVFSGLVGAGHAGEREYAIRLTPKCHAGQKCEFSAEGSSKMRWVRVMFEGGVDKAERMSLFRFEGTNEVLEVDHDGHVKRSKITISRLEQTVGGQVEEMLQKGSVVVIVRKADGNDVLMEGKPVSKNLARLIRSAAFLPLPGLSDDEVFGTKRKVEIGGKWKCGPEKLAKFMSLGLGRVETEDAKGECSLEDVVEGDGKKCFRIKIETNAEKVRFPKSVFGVPVEKAKLASIYRCDIPMADFSGFIREDGKGKLEALGKMQGESGQPEGVVSITVDWSVEVKRKWMDVVGNEDDGK